MNAIMGEFKSMRETLKQEGLRQGVKSLWKRYGWKMVVAVFAYYLIRDVTLYIVIPSLIIKGLW